MKNSNVHIKGRFAPSPTGRMHAGNIFSALVAWLVAKSQGGTMVLRVEDLDRERSKPQFIDAVQRDFETLGLTWDEGPYFQHNRDEAYQAAFDSLVERGLVYPCFCTRADLHAASAPHHGEKLVYAGTCRALTAEQRAEKAAVRKPAMRLVVPDETIAIDDLIQGHFEQNLAHDCGDFLIRRSDEAFAYQLAVVVDDAALDALLERFKTPEAIIGHIAGITGLAPTCDPATPEELLQTFSVDGLRDKFPDLVQIQWR